MLGWNSHVCNFDDIAIVLTSQKRLVLVFLFLYIFQWIDLGHGIWQPSWSTVLGKLDLATCLYHFDLMTELFHHLLMYNPKVIKKGQKRMLDDKNWIKFNCFEFLLTQYWYKWYDCKKSPNLLQKCQILINTFWITKNCKF